MINLLACHEEFMSTCYLSTKLNIDVRLETQIKDLFHSTPNLILGTEKPDMISYDPERWYAKHGEENWKCFQ